MTSIKMPTHSRIHFGALLLTNGDMTFVSCKIGTNGWHLAESIHATDTYRCFCWLQYPHDCSLVTFIINKVEIKGVMLSFVSGKTAAG